jgi:SAM-dependent methyltransferase
MDEGSVPYQDTEWWRTIYSGIHLDLWLSVVPEGQAARDADFLQSAWQLPPKTSILDVACGHGRVAVELADRGFRLTGVDISSSLLREARRRADLRGVSIEWHERDMRSLPWQSVFDAAFCWGDGFGYFDDAGNRGFLEAIHRSLRPGGLWAMDMKLVAEVLFSRYRPTEAGQAGGIGVNIRRSYDARRGRLQVEYHLARSGAEERRVASYRIYSCSEVCRMLEEAGFLVTRLSDGAGTPFTVGSDVLRIVAMKGAEAARP